MINFDFVQKPEYCQVLLKMNCENTCKFKTKNVAALLESTGYSPSHPPPPYSICCSSIEFLRDNLSVKSGQVCFYFP